MKKEFYKDFPFDQKIDQCEIIKSKVSCVELLNKTIKCQIECDVKLFFQGKEEVKTLEIPFENEIDQEEISSCEASINKIDYFITCSRLTLSGEIEIKEKIRESEEFKIDPLKDSLLSSFISYKRNKEKDVEIVSTLSESEIKNQIDHINIDLNNLEKVNNEEENIQVPRPYELKEDEDDEIVIKSEPIKEDSIEGKKESILQDNYVSSYFYYKVGKNEKLTDILLKLQVSMDDFLKYNKQKEYPENTLLKFRRK